MKLFKITHKLGEPLKREINLSTDSTALVGINWLDADGNAYNPDADSLKVNGSAPEIAELEGVAYTCFQIAAGDAPSVTDYEVTWSKTEAGAETGKPYGFTFKVVTADRNVAEVGGVGGVPDTVMLKNDTLSTEDGEFEFEYTADNDAIELYVTGKYDGDEEYQTFIYDGGVDLTHTVEGNEREYAEYYVNGLTLNKTQSGDYNQAIYFADKTKLVGPDSSDNRKEFEAKTTPMTVTVSHQNKNEGAVEAKSELAPSYVRTLSVDNNETVHKAELKYDGVYIDEDGYKPISISIKDSDGNDLEFKCLGFDFNKYSPAGWFTFSNSSVTGLSSEGTTHAEFYLPKKNEGTDITTIGTSAFQSKSTVTYVEGKTITSIGGNAFRNCTSLTEANFPVCTSIGQSAFQSCSSMTTASMPICTALASDVFYGCNALTLASFPVCSGLGYEAFQYCSAMSMAYLPVCSSIGTNAFYGCSALTELNLSNSPMSVVRAMANFPWGISNTATKIVCSDGWVDRNRNEHPANA